MENYKTNTKKLKIESININGEGIAYEDKTKNCMKYVLPDEEVEAKIIYEKQNFCFCKLLNLTVKSPNRIVPKCNYFSTCGGCDFSHIDYKKSLDLKKQIISDYFESLKIKINNIYESPKVFNYRNKASFVIKNNEIGYQIQNTNDLVEIDECLICAPIINKVLFAFKKWISENPQFIKHLVVRSLNENFIATLVCTSAPKKLDLLISSFKNAFSNFGLYLNFNFSKDEILGREWKHIYGIKKLKDNFLGVDYEIDPYSFLQINDEVRSLLYQKVLEKIANETVVEGFSGSGILSAIIAKKAKKVIGVEINKTTVDDANDLALKNKIKNIEFINGDFKLIFPKLIKNNANATVLVDPPRSGLDKEILKTIKENKVKKIVYISCNPYTLKQEMTFLSSDYKCTSFELFDMFPQTSHIESLVVLELI